MGQGAQCLTPMDTCLQESEAVYTAFIKHLKESVDEAALQKLFESCGEIKSLKIGREPETNRSRVSLRLSEADCPWQFHVKLHHCPAIPPTSPPPPIVFRFFRQVCCSHAASQACYSFLAGHCIDRERSQVTWDLHRIPA